MLQQRVSPISRLLAGLCLYAIIGCGQAETVSVKLLLSSDAPYYLEVGRRVTSRLKTAFPDLDPAPEYVPTAGTAITPETLIIAVGTGATEHALEAYPGNPLLSLFIPKITWEQLVESHGGLKPSMAAVFLDQPLHRQLKLGVLLKPGIGSVASVLGPVSRSQKDLLKEEAELHDLVLHYAVVSEDENPVSVLAPLVESSDLFLAVPDQAVFNRVMAKWILYLSYRQKIPVIGFSKSYADAGALASVYSTPANIAMQGVELATDRLLGVTNDWGPVYPRYYTLHTNPIVARALGIHLPDEAELYQMFREAERVAQ